LKRLIITADDFGAARQVNDAVEAAHRGGVLTAASLMVAAPEAADAITRARRLPSLRVGLHLTLLQGRPALPPSAVPQLVNGAGVFPSNPAVLGTRLTASRAARRQLAAEITAQFAAFSDSGLTLDHCNAHLHFHLHPLVGRLIVLIGARFGLRAVRLRRRLAAAGLLVAERTFGLRWSGQMTGARLAGLIRQLPQGVSEIYLHPATATYPGAARGYRYAEELQALLAPEVIALCRDAALRLGGFGDFAPSGTPAAFPRAAVSA